MTFNTKELSRNRYVYIWRVLNLVINGWPSILATINDYVAKYYGVLNLVINGWPSIPTAFKAFSINLELF